MRREKEYLYRPPLNISEVDDLSSVCYDAMYTFAYALNSTINGNVMYNIAVFSFAQPVFGVLILLFT